MRRLLTATAILGAISTALIAIDRWVTWSLRKAHVWDWASHG